MNFSNIKLILLREIRDQARDRRTLFMVFVLPLLLYPLLGMVFLQVMQFRREKPSQILVVGAAELTSLDGDAGSADEAENKVPADASRDDESQPGLPPLVENNRFAGALFVDPQKAELLTLHFAPSEPRNGTRQMPDQLAEARRAVQAGEYDAALYFPADFADRLQTFRRTLQQRREQGQQAVQDEVPFPQILTTATEKSQIAGGRLNEVGMAWREQVVVSILKARGVPETVIAPFRFEQHDVADSPSYRGALFWSKILPVLLLIWALTGAFYPAIDLCAGEKERGTLETLLSSPAERSEIVLGKLLTVMLFSIITAVLNLASVTVTGLLVLRHQPDFGPPSPSSALWLAIALVPVAALFSALCLALAAFARSSKEGQYYLMPLLMITMPLVVLPMMPGVELNLGNSLVPVTGLVLLLRTVLQGASWEALQFLPVVVGVTLIACLLAIRWAIDQFNSESVLFRASDRLAMGYWLRHLWQDRRPTPNVAAAVFCGVVILVLNFYMNFALQQPQTGELRREPTFGDFAQMALVTQLVVILTPTLLMTVVLTNSPRQTLLLRRPPWWAVPAAVLLAAALHPAVTVLQSLVIQLYPYSPQSEQALRRIQAVIDAAPLWQVILVVAATPAVCEELAFRGFILSGFRHLGHKWRAIIYSALFFGLTHMILQQSLIVCLVGTVVGYLAVQSGSLLPGVVFHLVHNTLAVSVGRMPAQWFDRWPALRTWIDRTPQGLEYSWSLIVAGGLLGVLILLWFRRISCPKSAEEEFQEAIHRGLNPETEYAKMAVQLEQAPPA